MPDVLEKKKEFKDWTDPSDIYADLSSYPRSVSYYVKCPVCRKVHGDFKTMRDAHRGRLCRPCDLETLEKIKKQIHQVVHEPQKKVKPLAAFVRENEEQEDPSRPENQNQPSDDPEYDQIMAGDSAGVVDRLLGEDWTWLALVDLAAQEDAELDDLIVSGGDYDSENPELSTYFDVDVHGRSYLVMKDDDVAESLAKDQVAWDAKYDISIFNKDVVRSFIDAEKLADAVGDPHEDFAEEYVNGTYNEQLDKLVEEGEIESDDPTYFDSDGVALEPTREMKRAVSDMLDDWVANNKPTIDPWEWLEDVYGKQEALEWATKHVGVDVDAFAAYCVRSDGWQPFLARYDGNSIDLKGGAVAVRKD